MADFTRIASNPFYLATLGLSFIGWIITFAGSIAAKIIGSPWFFIVFELFLILGIGVAIATDSLRQYRLVILIFLGVMFINTITFAENINSSAPQLQAIGAGSIFLSIVTFVWIFSFGSEEGSAIANSINSLSINKVDRNMSHNGGFPPSGPIPMIPTAAIQESGNQNQGSHTVAVSPNVDYAYKAKALYDYQANPDDQNELSFTKGEILDIADNKGKWWQAKKADGSVGIAPSNYLQIV